MSSQETIPESRVVEAPPEPESKPELGTDESLPPHVIHRSPAPKGIRPPKADPEVVPTLVKITMEYDDGVVKVLEGQDAQDWNEDYGGLQTMTWVHGGSLSEFPVEIHFKVGCQINNENQWIYQSTDLYYNFKGPHLSDPAFSRHANIGCHSDAKFIPDNILWSLSIPYKRDIWSVSIS